MRLALVVLLFTTSLVQAQRTLYVSEERLADVRLTEQFRTLREAVRIARAGDRIVLAAGSYSDEVDLRRSGRADAPIILEAAAGARVNILSTPGAPPWRITGDHVHLRGLHFQRRVVISGANAQVADCSFSTPATALTLTGVGTVIRNCTFDDNAGPAVSADRAHGLLLTECSIRATSETASAGVHIRQTRGLVVERTQFVANRAPALWIDAASEGPVVRHCLFTGNTAAAIRLETALDARVHDNIIAQTAAAPRGANDDAAPPLDRAGAGILLITSRGALIERNLLHANEIALALLDRPSMITLSDAPSAEWLWTSHHTLRHNSITRSRQSHLVAQFHASDQRHRPAAGIGSTTVPATSTAPPLGLSLESLNLTFTDNLYTPAGQTPFAVWGDPRRPRAYSTLGDFRADLSLDSTSLTLDFPFSAPNDRDYRLPSNHPALLLGAYPRGSIPGAQISDSARAEGSDGEANE